MIGETITSQYKKWRNRALLTEYDNLKKTNEDIFNFRIVDFDDPHDEVYGYLNGSIYKKKEEEIEKIRLEILNCMNKK